MPAVVDLAAMRSAVARAGGDPAGVNPHDPGRPGDRPLGPGRPVRRTRERLRGATSSGSTGATASATRCCGGRSRRSTGSGSCRRAMGICHQVNLEHLGRVVQVRDGVALPDTLRRHRLAHHDGQRAVGAGLGRRRDRGRGRHARPADVPAPAASSSACATIGALPPGTTATDLVLTLTADAPRARRGRQVRRVLRRRALVAVGRGPRHAVEHVPRVRGDGRRSSRATHRRCATCATPAAATSSTWSSATRRNRGCSAPTTTPSRCSARRSTSTCRRSSRRWPARAGRRTASPLPEVLGVVRRGVPRAAWSAGRRSRPARPDGYEGFGTQRAPRRRLGERARSGRWSGR